ncbi:MAG: Mannosyl-glycoprotein endo-beta-N-acetylglucosamidase [Bacteroidetes bacterium]|nr:Mannosyl-glycoprotein endo-beta-N-acetylglucosamidase [Bacteroidota bacterium]
MGRKTVIFLSLMISFMASFAQNKSQAYLNYIEKYAKLAIEQQQRFNIPASITLAQGLLESSAGQSELSQSSNNHFGIKCHNDWDGDKVYKKDDNVDPDCFRKYNEVEDSYIDHSLFLTNRRHYASLFELNPTDYKGWAYGLKKAGYASDAAYPAKLIKIIEDYELHKYDLGKKAEYLATNPKRLEKNMSTIKTTSSTTLKGHTLFRNNKVLCVFSLPGDTYSSIADEFNISEKKILKYNDLAESTEILPGTIIYVKSKKNIASAEYMQHQVKDGENLYRISQKYAIKLKKLYDLNKLDYSQGASLGMILKLR